MAEDFKKIFIACGIDQKKFSKFFKAFGDPTRQKILAFLSISDRTVTEIVDAIGYSQPTISRHLSVLKNADIVADRREGRSIYYSLNKDIIRQCCVGFCDCLNVDAKPVRGKKKKK
ncbi:MAG: winged helix-turn-helix transcriptional regulator [candidate division Zixibacteria bacterium]|nr:winged helix-turn-helix transcriptional regulator [candidate division Zixibacteria bacterium]